LQCTLSSRALRRRSRKPIPVDDLTHEFVIPRTEKARKGKMAQIKPWKSRRNPAALFRIGLISSRDAQAE